MRTLLLLAPLLVSGGLAAQTFTLTSTEGGGGAPAQRVYSASGAPEKHQPPDRRGANAPAGTKSFAVTMYDPDAPTGSGWWHWVVFDLPASTAMLPTGAGTPGMPGMPEVAVQSRTDFGGQGYGGPCPPVGHGAHRYVVTVHALGVEKLGLDAQASPALVGYTLNANTLAKASLIFYHSR